MRKLAACDSGVRASQDREEWEDGRRPGVVSRCRSIGGNESNASRWLERPMLTGWKLWISGFRFILAIYPYDTSDSSFLLHTPQNKWLKCSQEVPSCVMHVFWAFFFFVPSRNSAKENVALRCAYETSHPFLGFSMWKRPDQSWISSLFFSSHPFNHFFEFLLVFISWVETCHSSNVWWLSTFVSFSLPEFNHLLPSDFLGWCHLLQFSRLVLEAVPGHVGISCSFSSICRLHRV